MSKWIWSPSREDELARLYARGWSAGMIAQKFGVTRNMIIGKINRLKLPKRTSSIKLGYGEASRVPHPHDWTKAEDEQLRALIAERATRAGASAVIGRTVPAVVKRAQRLGLRFDPPLREKTVFRPAATKRRDPPTAKERPPVVREPKPAPPPAPEPMPVPVVVHLVPQIEAEPVSILARRSDQCAWICPGRDAEGMALVCGERVKGGTDWCPTHYRMVYTPIRKPLVIGRAA